MTGIDLCTGLPKYDMDVVISADHFIPAGYCAMGARRWFQERGLSFSEFLDDGGWPLSKFGEVDGALAALYDIAIKQKETGEVYERR